MSHVSSVAQERKHVPSERGRKVEPRLAIVGGIPEPIGGVTTFIKRVIRKEACVTHLFDLYPSKNKQVPGEYKGKYICHSSKIVTLLRLFVFCVLPVQKVVHFNFSTPKALVLLAFLPKIRSTWILTLHHGQLGTEVTNLQRYVLSKKVNKALSLSPRQRDWFLLSLASDNVATSSSYVLPAKPVPDQHFKTQVAEYKKNFSRIIVCSGFPTAIYNHLLAIKAIAKFPDALLICCLYGPGDLREEIKQESSKLDNAVILESLTEDNFNYLLSNSALYLRLNSEDSFGIAVADAINFGVQAVCTDVCPRYPGSILIHVPSRIEDAVDAIKNVYLSGDGHGAACDSVLHFKYSSYV